MASKYKNKKIVIDGITFHSTKEGEYYCNLKLLEKYNQIKGFQMQVPYVINVQGKHICKYYLDFLVYYSDGKVEYVDVKGMRTPVYKIKKKLVEAIHKIKITEV